MAFTQPESMVTRASTKPTELFAALYRLIKKPISLCIALSALVIFSPSINAMPQAGTSYLGLGLGWGHYIKGSLPQSTNGKLKSKNVFAGRLYLGYNFTDMIGGEIGMSEFLKAKSSNGTAKLNRRARVLDLLGVANLPIGTSTTLYGKGGVAYVWEKVNSSNNTVITNGSKHAFRPKVAIGIKQDLSPELAVGVSYDYVASGNFGSKSNGRTSELGLLTGNLEYSF